jgi:4-hydroxy-2-oxoheptanedioate aldolase
VGPRRLNRVIEVLDRGDVVVSSLIPNGSLEQAQAYGDSDYDMVIIEMEHHGFDFPNLRMSLQMMMSRRRIAQDGLCPSVVPTTRIPPAARETNQWVIKQALDIGVYGLVVPQLETPEEALTVVNAARYPARRDSSSGGGQRGYFPHVAARYWGLSSQDYVEKADVWPLNPDGELLIIGIIESQKGVENVESILECTNGIGAIWPGQGDLAADMGLIGQTTHPEVEEQLLAVLQKCQIRNIPCVGVATNLEDAAKKVKQGFRIIIAPMERGMATVVRSAASTTELTH